MNLGKEIVSTVVYSQSLGLLPDKGFGKQWLSTPAAAGIFTDKDKQAYSWLLDYYQKHRNIPKLTVFRNQFPEASYQLSASYIPLEELYDVITDKVNAYLVADILVKVIDLQSAGKIDDAINYLKTSSAKLSTDVFAAPTGYDLASPDFDLEGLLNTELEMGIPFGIEPVDNAFWGFQPGQLVTLMGRQKSGKSWMTLNSAFHAWLSGYSVLFFSVEMGEALLHQRMLSLGAHVSPSRLRRGVLSDKDKDKVRDFHGKLTSDPGRFVISKKKTMVTVDDILDEIHQHKPHVIYIDGYSFMIDRKTGRMTDDWQANENVAAELKSLAMEKDIVVFVNTQVQEKQYSAKNGIEARSIQGGTGLLKASDLVLGQDKEATLLTITSQLSRFEEFDPVYVEVDFDTMTFSVVQRLEELESKGV